MFIVTSTCHICLEELDFDLRYIKKKCCPTEAFICNECWEKIMNTDYIVQCPICRDILKKEIVVTMNSITTNIVLEDIENQNILVRRITLTRIQKIKKFVKWYFISTILGFSVIMLIVYNFHPKSTTFQIELNYFIIRPLFWFLCLTIGFFILCILDIFFGRRFIGDIGS